MTKRYVNTSPGQRIDHPDFRQVAEVSPRDGIAQLGAAFLLGDAAPSQIIRGFAPSDGGSGVVEVTRDVTGSPGLALLSARENGVTVDGLLMAGGPNLMTFDLSSELAGTYSIYIKFVFAEEEAQNRFFWDPDAAPPAETSRVIPTRRAESWAMTCELVSPGPEWLKIGEAVLTLGPPAVAVSDVRDHFFEGEVSTMHEVTDAQWGGLGDRSIVRTPTAGVFGVRRAIRGLQRQVQDLIGGTFPFHGWWADIASATGGLTSLSDAQDKKLARDGSQEMEGDIVPDLDDTHDLGTTLKRWAKLWVTDIDAAGAIDAASASFSGAISAASAAITGQLASSTAVLTTSLTADQVNGSTSVAGGTVTATTVVSGADGSFTGNVAANAFQSVNNPAATVAQSNKLHGKNIPKAWVVYTDDGGGGLLVVNGFNIASVVWVGGGSNAVVTFAQPLVGTPCAVGTYSHEGLATPDRIVLVKLAAAEQLLVQHYDSGGLVVDQSTTSHGFTMVVVFGVQ